MAISRQPSARFTVDPGEIRGQLGVSRERLGRTLDVSAKTIERWEEQRTLPSNAVVRERLVALQQIVELGLQVYTPEAFRAFMTIPLSSFQGRTALQLVASGEASRVYSEIVADYEGTSV